MANVEDLYDGGLEVETQPVDPANWIAFLVKFGGYEWGEIALFEDGRLLQLVLDHVEKASWNRPAERRYDGVSN